MEKDSDIPDQEQGAGARGVDRGAAALTIWAVATLAAVAAYFFTERTVGLGSAVVGGATAVIGFTAAIVVVRKRQSKISWWALAACLLVCSVVPPILGRYAALVYWRSACGAWGMMTAAFLKQYMYAVYETIEKEEGDLPPALALWLVDGTLDPRYFTTPRCGRWTLDDIHIGPWTLGDLQAGRVEREQLAAIAAASGSDEWETVGPFLLSRDRRALLQLSPRVIVGCTLRPERRGNTWQFLFADSHVLMAWESDLADIVLYDDAARRELGLPLTPEAGPIAIGRAMVRRREADTKQ